MIKRRIHRGIIATLVALCVCAGTLEGLAITLTTYYPFPGVMTIVMFGVAGIITLVIRALIWVEDGEGEL